jgi:hypothetical protein
MLLKKMFCGAATVLALSLGAGCAHHQGCNNTCTKPAVVSSVPIAPVPQPPCCGAPGAVPPPGPLVPAPKPAFIPSAQSGVIVPQPY